MGKVCFFGATLLSVIGVNIVMVTGIPAVNISDGQIVGFTQDVNGTDVHTFFGIPFAKPPIGNLRFRRPEPAEPWDGVFNATTQPNSCKQPITASSPLGPHSEDCLYLNVWSPSLGGPLKAVMVWIYGGSFVSGSITLDAYNGKYLAAYEDVVIVSMQYRLGGAGFLYLGTDDAPGNVALLDQQLALKWVQSNIERFGGDPGRVTLFGESAGSICIGYHLLAPTSQPLIKYAIMQSGALINFMDSKSALAYNREFVKQLGCKQTKVKDIIKCLESYDPVQMYDTLTKMSPALPALPVTVDGMFLTDSPERIFEASKHKRTDILIGTTADEGSLFLWMNSPSIFTFQNRPTLTREQFLQLTRISADPITSMAAEFEYTVQSDYPSANYTQLASDIVGDQSLVCPTERFARNYATKGERVYMYQLSHRPENHPFQEWFGVMHGMDIDYVFGSISYPFLPDERRLSRRIQRYWASFAKTGFPNDGQGNDWPLYEEPSFASNILDLGPFHVDYRLKTRKCKFWEEYLPNLIKELKKTPPISSGQKKQEAAITGFLVLVLLSATVS